MASNLNQNDDEEEITIIELPSSVPLNEDKSEENIFSNSSSFKSDHTDPKLYSPRAYFSKQIASTRDRFAALLLDLLLLFYFISGAKVLFQKSPTYQNWFLKMKPVMQEISGAVLCFLIVILYYVIFESTIGASLGKVVCRLRVITFNGKTPSFAKNIVRNFIRLIDMPIVGLIAIFSMESSPLNQRLGDRLAETIVIKKTRKRITPLNLKNIALSSTFTRLAAFLIDSILYLSFLWFYVANFNPESKSSFSILFNLFPIFILLYFMIFDFLVSSTPGKIILSRRTVLENGEPLDGTSAILRNLCKPIDLILGYPLIALTRKKQRLGDLLSETIVIKKSEKSGWIAVGILLVVLGALAFFSHKNPNRNWLIPQIKAFKSNLLQSGSHLDQSLSSLNDKKSNPDSISTENSGTVLPTTSPLKITEFYFSAGADPNQIRPDGIFHKGDLIFTFFKVSGFQKNSIDEISLFEDVTLKNPQNKTIFNQKELIRLSQAVQKNVDTALYANQIELKSNASGTYQLIIVIRDEIGKTKLVYEKSFTLQ